MGALILVAGYLATGKTTYSEKISRALNVPRVNKDEVKEKLTDAVGFKNRAENKALSVASVEVMAYMAERLLSCGVPLIVESNFHAGEGELFTDIAKKYETRTLTLRFTGDLGVCHWRFMERFNSPLRHYTHKSSEFTDFENFRVYNLELAEFSAGDVLEEIDATDFRGVEIGALIERVRRFIQIGL